ncbi:hypothetical protein [Vagococcus hydrophili]|uniref:Uncharacterized protein n=1 Tax=Vagococcus hydrophili TaxID=2714947 RepID=A0A6G8ASE0_9ENTE|nr:hypothetical protein [Vagococcus hydrophili]QIL47991.1 hypothetical protein G7082_05310 [Vagococcus hydrophili]
MKKFNYLWSNKTILCFLFMILLVLVVGPLIIDHVMYGDIKVKNLQYRYYSKYVFIFLLLPILSLVITGQLSLYTRQDILITSGSRDNYAKFILFKLILTSTLFILSYNISTLFLSMLIDSVSPLYFLFELKLFIGSWVLFLFVTSLYLVIFFQTNSLIIAFIVSVSTPFIMIILNFYLGVPSYIMIVQELSNIENNLTFWDIIPSGSCLLFISQALLWFSFYKISKKDFLNSSD